MTPAMYPLLIFLAPKYFSAIPSAQTHERADSVLLVCVQGFNGCLSAYAKARHWARALRLLDEMPKRQDRREMDAEGYERKILLAE